MSQLTAFYVLLLFVVFTASIEAKAGGGSEPVDLSPRPLQPNKITESKSDQTKLDKPQLSDLAPIKAAVRHYGEFASVKMSVAKRFVPALVGATKESEGELYYSRGKLRLEISKPQKSLLILDGQQIWLVEDGSEFGVADMISRIGLQGKRRKANAFLAFLFEDIDAWNEFDVLKKNGDKRAATLQLKPKSGANLPDISKLVVRVNKDRNEIQKIAYWDQMENEVSYVFSKIEFLKEEHSKKFRYKPPKGAEVTEI